MQKDVKSTLWFSHAVVSIIQLSFRYSFGLGYGLSMTANAALGPAVAKIQNRTPEV